MDKEQALLFFPISEDEDPQDKWEEIFFEHKQFFVTRPVVAKVFQARIKKMMKQFLAYQTIAEINVAVSTNSIREAIHFSGSVLTAFQELFQYRAGVKQNLLRLTDVSLFVDELNYWLKIESIYNKNWVIDLTGIDTTDIVVSKEKDPMLLLGAIRRWDNNELKTFQSLKENINDLPVTLLDEVKRLSLLCKLSV